MNSGEDRTPERTLIIGCTAFSGLDSVAWADQVLPNIPDYDLVLVSVPHMSEDFLTTMDEEFLGGMRKKLVRFLHSGGKVVALVSPRNYVKRSGKYPEYVSNGGWSPLTYETPLEDGRSIVWKSKKHVSYLEKMKTWTFYLRIPQTCLTRELTDYFGSPDTTKYRVPFDKYLENRYSRALAGECRVEITQARERSSEWNSWKEYPDSPDVTTGRIVLLPLIDGVSAEEALADILREEIAYSATSPEPDWTRDIDMPFVADLKDEVTKAEIAIADQKQKIDQINARISDICSFRRLLYATGTELESIVKTSLERLGAKVSPAKYSNEEFILEVHGKEFLLEVKGVAKSISLTHLRQLNDYLLKYHEDTGSESKGILIGNAWRNTPPEMRGTEETPEFPDNVVKRAEQWGISLVSSRSFFEAFVRTLKDPSLSGQVLNVLTAASGVAEFDSLDSQT
jgi:hypothetical protein